ncbi:hypothetical protein WAI453_003755 [Rhynchosporium graminicola]
MVAADIPRNEHRSERPIELRNSGSKTSLLSRVRRPSSRKAAFYWEYKPVLYWRGHAEPSRPKRTEPLLSTFRPIISSEVAGYFRSYKEV